MKKTLWGFLLVLMVFFMIPGSSEAAELSKLTGLKLSGDTLSWNKFSGNNVFYRIEITNGGIMNTSGTSVNLKEEIFGKFGYRSGTYQMKVCAVDASSIGPGKTVVCLSQYTDVTYTYKNDKELDKPQDFKFSDNVLSWSAVDNAQYYSITVLCGDKITRKDQITNTKVNIIPYLQKGNMSYQVKVRAEAEGY